MKNTHTKSESETLRQKAEALLKLKPFSEAEMLALIQELAFQNEEKAKRADELIIANKELAFQNEEKTKRADELLIANKELAFQNKEKAKRADEIIIANEEIAFQKELIIAKNKAIRLTHELEVHQVELEMQNKELSYAKEKAETDAKKYAELYDFAPSGYFTLSNEGTITEVNLSGATLLGKARAQLSDNRFGFFVSNDTKPIFNLFLDKVFSSKANQSCDLTLSTRGNLPMFVHLTGIVSENGEQCLVSMVDITDSRIMTALQQSEQRFRAVVEWSPYSIVIHRDLKIIYVNPAAIKMFGASSAEDFVGTKILDRVHPDCHQIVLDRIRRGIDDGINAPLTELKYFKFDGTIIDVEVQGTPITYDGAPCIHAAMRDITERKQVEVALRESEANLRIAHLYTRSLIEASLDPLLTINTDGKISDVNSATENATGLLRNQLIGTDFSDYFTDPEKAKTSYQKVFEQGQVINYPLTICHASGKLIDVQYNANVFKDEHGKILGVFAAARDITELKQAEDELRRSHARYISMISNISDVIGIMGADGIMTYKSPNIEKWFGWLPEDRVGTSGFSTVHPDDLDRVGKVFYSLFDKDNSVKTLGFRYLCKDGSYKPIELTAANLLNDPFIHGVLLNYRDITARKQIEEQLKQTATRLALATTAGGVGIWEFDIVNNVLVWDDQMIALYGIDKKNFSGAYEAWKVGLHPDDLLRGDKEIQMAISGKKEFNTEFRVLWPDGTIRFIRALAVVQRDDSGKALLMIGTNWDITDQKLADKKLRESEENLQKINTEKDKFFSIISHDLRGPFNGFLGLTRLMAEELPGLSQQEIQKMAGAMKDSATNLFNLLENLLEWSRMQQGGIIFNPESIWLMSIMNESVHPVIDLADKKGVEIRYEIQADLEVFADEYMLASTIRNLASNAVKFTFKGGKVTIAAKSVPGLSVEISVSDTGIGMNPEMVHDLFRFDVQTNRRGTENEPSSGLGLLLCKDFVEMNGGRIWVESEVDKGSTFSFTLPTKAQE